MNSIDAILEDKVLKKTPLDLQKRFPIYHACPKYLAAHCCIDQASSRKFIECGSLKSLQFFHLIKTSNQLHEDPDHVPINVHEEVVDLVDVVRLLDEHD